MELFVKHVLYPFHVVLAHSYKPSPLLTSLYTPHNPTHAAWQRKRHAYAPPSYAHGSTPPSCLAQPYYGGNISPQHLSLCQSIPCNHTMEAQAAKQYKTNVTQLINQKVFYMRPHNIITYFTHSYLCIVRFRIICKIITHPESLLQSLVAS
jgi:hypothetical protein